MLPVINIGFISSSISASVAHGICLNFAISFRFHDLFVTLKSCFWKLSAIRFHQSSIYFVGVDAIGSKEKRMSGRPPARPLIENVQPNFSAISLFVEFNVS